MKNISIRDLSEIWLKYKVNSIRKSSMAQYEKIVYKYIDKYLGDIALSELQVINVLEMANDLSQKLASKTVQDIIVVLKGILKYAAMMYEIPFPINAIPTIKVKKAKVQILSTADLYKLEDYLQKNVNAKNLGLLVCIYTGIRLGEICALKWEDIDLEEKKMDINKIISRVKDESKSYCIISLPKTESSIREIPINDELHQILKQHYQKSGYIITGKESFLDPRSYQYYFKKILKNLGIGEYHFHVLRHTFATRCVQCDVDVKSLSEILGHSSVNITLNIYVHSSFSIKQQQLNKLKLR